MTSAAPNQADSPRTFASGYLFGIPLGDLGWFGSLLIGLASGFIAFFATTFVSIMSILIYNSAAHANVDFAVSYRLIGFPIGVAVGIFALAYLGRLWFKRVFRSS
jgi:hypothetical protein